MAVFVAVAALNVRTGETRAVSAVDRVGRHEGVIEMRCKPSRQANSTIAWRTKW